MTGEQSRQLKVGDRVCWDRSTTDFGTVVDVAWNGVTIRWDDATPFLSSITTWRGLNARLLIWCDGRSISFDDAVGLC
jgi:hypothetical protein